MADAEELSPSLMQLLPKDVKRRVNALKKLQLECLNIEAKFFKDVFKLECDYHKYFKDLFDKREKIITGSVEPTDEEANFVIPGAEESSDSADEEIINQFREKLSVNKLHEEGCKGIPEFWLTIFRNVDLLNDMIQPHDEPILKHLTDVQVEINDDKMGFVLKFLFSPNPYFTNTCLTKEYEMKCAPEENDPWSFDGPEIYKCKGCTIDWNKNQNVTLKTIRKRQRHKSKGAVRTVVKSVMNDSFFNFFNPPSVPDVGEMEDATQAILTSDFEIGHYIRDKIIPRAILYFTGEALEDEMDEDSEEGSDEELEESDEEDEEEEEDESGNEAPPNNEKPAHKGNKNKNKNKNNQQQECAQQ